MQKKSRVEEQKYREFISLCPCLVCMRPAPNDPHHWQKKGFGKMGGKADFERMIPLCREHHQMFHSQGRESFAKKYDIDIEYVIERMNLIWKECLVENA